MSGYWLFAASVAVIAAFVTRAVIRSRGKEGREKRAAEAERAAKTTEFLKLLDRAEQGDKDAENKLIVKRWSTGNTEWAARLQVIKDLVSDRHDLEYNGPAVRNQHAAWQQAVGTSDEIERLAGFVKAYVYLGSQRNLVLMSQELGIGRRGARKLLRRLTQEAYNQFEVQILEDEDSFLGLRELIHLSREPYSVLSDAGVKRLEYPVNWDQAVTMHFRNPHIEDFASRGEVHPGQLRLMAAEALRVTDIVDIKRALAYANAYPRYREELGDILTAELAKAVATHHGELSTVKTMKDAV